MGVHYNWKQWLWSSFIICMLIFCVKVNHGDAATFKDVPESHPSIFEIEFLADSGIIKGYQDQTFKPSNNVTNSQVALMITRALNLNVENRPAPGFQDLGKIDEVTYKAIAAVVDEGIFPKGDTFRPFEPITRGEMAQVLVNAFHLKGTTNQEFKDVSKNHTFYQAIKVLAANNITTGFEDGTFKPSQPLTRAHFSTFMSRIIEPDFIPVSSGFGYNKQYQYIYELNEGYTAREYFSYLSSDELGDWWQVSDENNQYIHYVNRIDKKGFTFTGYLENKEIITDFHIPYPVKRGTSWSYSYKDEYQPVTYVVTSMSKKITTPAGTFHPVMEIVSSDGYQYYYSKELGHICTKDLQTNAIVYQLIDLKKRSSK
ncbi:S-layer homology domain-containing protein [Ureibacillus sp. FSL W8-0352]|uniref:S-layer homology domain-containing protein n=1 Tax=Ureibacillus sp. FSL W8-0352 TaxID=2954596 RepID=UPI0030F870D9